MIIRPVEHGDRDAWLPLWEGYNAFYGRSGPRALPREITDTTWERFLDPAEPVHALVAHDDGAHDGALVGLVHFLYHRSTTALGPVCYLQDLFTTESARGRGVGRGLITAVDSHARTAGAGRVYWQTHETNTTARTLYDQVAATGGFIVYTRFLT